MINVFAPAKVNLFLHVIDRFENGYHRLESLVSFADFGDRVYIEPADNFQIEIKGEFKNLIQEKDNLVAQAAQKLSALLDKDLKLKITLEKNIPIGAGLGGGSADAAATVRALLQYWDSKINDKELIPALVSMGADVPMCFKGQAAFVENIGDKITPHVIPHNINAVLIFPHQHCSTPDIFSAFKQEFSKPVKLPIQFKNDDFLDFLNKQQNDLTIAATIKTPVIKDILRTLENINGCSLARMSGSGSSCFGLFKNAKEAKKHAVQLQEENPNWWVRDVILNEA